MKKMILTLGSAIASTSAIAAVVSCSDDNKELWERDDKIILTENYLAMNIDKDKKVVASGILNYKEAKTFLEHEKVAPEEADKMLNKVFENSKEGKYGKNGTQQNNESPETSEYVIQMFIVRKGLLKDLNQMEFMKKNNITNDKGEMIDKYKKKYVKWNNNIVNYVTKHPNTLQLQVHIDKNGWKVGEGTGFQEFKLM